MNTDNRRWTSIVVALALAVPAAASAGGPDLSGTWTMTIAGKAPPGKNFAHLTFSGEGEELSVTMRGKGGELHGRVEVDGEEIRFHHAPPGKKASVAVFAGRVHGDLMGGAGMYAHALNPIPTNFQDPGTIAMLREAFLFWRIAKGAPGLPEEGGPWQSAMPAWELFLTEEEMWNVILFLYDFTGYKPRAVELH